LFQIRTLSFTDSTCGRRVRICSLYPVEIDLKFEVSPKTKNKGGEFIF
jgi:hypothetical protein